MDRVIPIIEQVIADVGFTGFLNLGSGISVIEKAAAVFRELGMSTGVSLCTGLADLIRSCEYDRAAAVFARLCCYCECISGTGAARI